MHVTQHEVYHMVTRKVSPLILAKSSLVSSAWKRKWFGKVFTPKCQLWSPLDIGVQGYAVLLFLLNVVGHTVALKPCRCDRLSWTDTQCLSNLQREVA